MKEVGGIIKTPASSLNIFCRRGKKRERSSIVYLSDIIKCSLNSLYLFFMPAFFLIVLGSTLARNHFEVIWSRLLDYDLYEERRGIGVLFSPEYKCSLRMMS